MQKGFAQVIILVGLVMVIVIAGGAYYLGKSSSTAPKPSPNPAITSQVSKTPQPTTAQNPQPSAIPMPTPDPTADWKIFNSDFGYSFKYPKNFWITSGETRRIKDGRLNYEHGDAPPAPQGTVGFLAIVESMSDSADVLANQKLDDFTKYRVLVDKTILVSGYKTRYVELESTDNIKILDILVFIQKDNSYAIYLMVANDNKSSELGFSKEQLRSTFDQILSTFKFL